ncbi:MULTISPECIES: DEAD/DEAH box helicase [unclassified Paenibacillus]|uniref:DEAD/DEAH box helicase n=1 Tax=unclassified Paenibacillus TaxID=185978 RepID=UPI001AE2B1E1|nr:MULTISPECIES: DEAD/DEAH box helicase [unclassified Paenibacillus]MBP1153418.1 SNF2 family DNA or RNA helicase [Paenibacillus sp. PvP091]MBP1171199.1 SNF2 family DNA or RNA helicase [Paenibacillus sp. PvR098]MBP2442227.1 SNF2 family DNA or RNA helicase [Paenibacillus sp. PvP052]
MDSMIDTGNINVNVRWAPQGGFFLWGARYNGGICDAYDLRDWLFAWHAPSFYGTFIEVTESMNMEGVLLPSLEALDYMAAPSYVQHQRLDFSRDLEELTRLAPAVKEALTQGRFMPDFAKWKAGELGWKLQLPEEESALAASPVAQQWMDQLIPDWIEADGVMRQSLEQLERSFPLLSSGKEAVDLWMDEEDWLISIGWQSDGTPFRTCLKLEEPAVSGGAWPLRVVLQDRGDKDVQYEMAPTDLGALAAAEPDAAIAEALPEAWREHLGRAVRDAEKWGRMLPWLATGEESLRSSLTPDEAWELLVKGSLRLIESGYSVFLPDWWERIRKWRPRLKAKIKSSVGAGPQPMFGLGQLMQFDWKIALGDIELTEEEFRELLEQNRRLVQIHGQWVQLDPVHLAQLQSVMHQVQKNQGLSLRDVLELHLLGTSEGEEDKDFHRSLKMEVELNDQLQELVKLLNHAKRPPLTEPPDSFRGTLRPYQVEGISWLMFLRECGLGGCLADDMGLGKTIQMITYLLLLREKHLTEGTADPSPSLLICPTSVLGNWQKELQRFAPDLRVHLHYGPGRAKGETFAESCRDCDLVLTTYTLAHLDETELASMHWESICLDEAQNIKNAYTKQAASIRKLTGRHRIALTGTPIENRLTELWSIFDFLNPGYLGTLRDFTQRYVGAIERTQDPELIAKVQRLIRPFLLRRLKKDPSIQLDLPEKYEYKTYISLTTEQATLYETYIRDMFERIDTMSPMERRGMILAALTKLKQICNHPALLTKESPQSPWRGRSNKVERLLEMVQELRQEGDKCLIFTQFVESGLLLQRVFGEELGGKIPFLHGGSSKAERDRMIETFQNEAQTDTTDSGIFLLSLKAGGTGLNLTAANHVFHFDRWWNPAVENQATDRAFRIGQTRHVQVHKFVTLGTLEERIDEMIDKKMGLSQQIVGSGEQWITELSTDDLKDLFSLRSEWVEK